MVKGNQLYYVKVSTVRKSGFTLMVAVDIEVYDSQLLVSAKLIDLFL